MNEDDLILPLSVLGIISACLLNAYIAIGEMNVAMILFVVMIVSFIADVILFIRWLR